VGNDKNGYPDPDLHKTIQNSVGNDKNGYPDPDLHKTMINVTNESSDGHKKNPQRRNLGRNL
jgi:hypothetical protein